MGQSQLVRRSVNVESFGALESPMTTEVTTASILPVRAPQSFECRKC